MFGRLSDIDLRMLRIFNTVVETGGFAVATAKLNVAESTVSQYMSDLEKRLGVRLCERGRAGFRLTKAGEEVYRATTELLQDVDRFRDRLSQVTSSISGRFAIGLPDAIASLDNPILLAGLRTFTLKAPDLHLHVEMLTPRDLERQVLDGKLHAAISPDHRRVAGLDYQPLFDERNELYCGEGHPLFRRPDTNIGMDDLEAGGRISRGYLERFDAEFFSTENYRATVYQTEAAALLILTGTMIGFLPCHYARPWVEAGQMRPLLPDRFNFTPAFNLITRREMMNDPRLVRLLRAFSDSGDRRINAG